MFSCEGDGGIYFIKIIEADGVASASIGFIELQSMELRYENRIPVSPTEFAIKKFSASGGVAFILAEPRTIAGGRGLYRININTMDVARIEQVIDFNLQGQDLYLVAKNDAGVSVSLNELSVPVGLAGEGSIRIKDIVDNRLVIVGNADESEIIDIRAGKSLYRYSDKYKYLAPDEYSLAVQAVDENIAEADDRTMIFYKIFIDGVEVGRTDSGPAGLQREFRTRVEPNKYHLVKLERWALNSGKGRYDRENNIRQPKVQNIYIPMNRVVKLIIRSDRKGYSYEVAPVYQ
jgi:hypothetical protein